MLMTFTNVPGPHRVSGNDDHPRDDGPPPGAPPRTLAIDTGRTRRWIGLVGYVLFFVLVAGALVWLFAKFTSSMRLALLLVGFMVTYMLVMGYVASRKAGEDERGNLR